MVRNSLKSFIDKYPYFFNRSRNSNFYKSSNVNNTGVQRMYNDVFKVYESMHINKRLLVWREQSKPYDYKINFEANYPLLEKVYIYKDNKLIYYKDFIETEKVTNFTYTYSANYIRSNMIEVKAYQCSECGEIYYDTKNPQLCENTHLNDKGERIATLRLMNTYKCSECDEIYYDTTNPQYCNTPHLEDDEQVATLEKIHIYKCLKCGQLYFSENRPSECENCYIEDYATELPLKIRLTWNEEDPSIKQVRVTILKPVTEIIEEDTNTDTENTDNDTDTEDVVEIEDEVEVEDEDEKEEVLSVLLNNTNNWEIETIKLPVKEETGETINYELSYTENPKYDIDFVEIEKHHTPSMLDSTPPLYYNDDTVQIEDNNRDYVQYHFKKIHPSDKLYSIELIDNNTNEIVDIVHLDYENQWESDSKILPITNDDGDVNDYIISDDTDLEITLNNLDYQSPYTYIDYLASKPKDNNYVNCINGHLTTFNENDEILLEDESTTEEDNTNNNEDTYTEVFIPISEIPQEKFLIKAVTYDEYTVVKGYPEYDFTYHEYAYMKESYSKGNDEGGFNLLENEYTHDYSLDELGVLNNIPRKVYNIIDDPNLYPYTEPSYNNHRTEDDYYYMKRMLEYNLRMWKMNPVSLELWKNYSIESELINRERYLLKVFDEQEHPFDEDTGLVKCWTPLDWEHKDKFCDGNLDVLKEYFFVNCNTLHPVVNQNVDCYLSVRNSLGEFIDEEFYVDIYKVHRDQNFINENGGSNLELLENHYIGTTFHIDSSLIDNPLNPKTTKYDLSYYGVDDYNMEDYLTTFRFNAYKLDGDLIGSTDIVLFLRNYYNSDIHVDNRGNRDKYDNLIPNYDELVDGSLQYPYLTIEEGLKHITGNDNVLGINIRNSEDKYYFMTENPYVISQTVKIIGNNYYENFNVETHEYSKWFVPRIVNNTGKKEFFDLVGAKNINLTLSNLRLLRSKVSAFILLNQWSNKNKYLNAYESVIIHGGLVIIRTVLNQQTYYPYDNITGTLTLRTSEGNILSDNTVYIKYNDEVISKGVTDSNGQYSFEYTLDEESNGVFSFVVGNESETFFEAETTVNINATKNVDYHSYTYTGTVSDTVTLVSHDNPTDTDVVFYSYDDVFNPEEVTPSETGDAEYTLTNLDFGKYLFYTTIDNERSSSVKDEYIVEPLYSLQNIISNVFIKNLVFDETDGELTYDTVSLSSDSKLGELDGIVVDVGLDEDDDLTVSTFKVDTSKYNDEHIDYSDALILKNAITDINFDSGKLSVERLGKFWE